MSDKQMFKVLVRWLGIIIFLSGVQGLVADLAIWTSAARYGALPPFSGYQEIIYVGVIILLGLVMIRFPEWIVQITWFEAKESSED